jgi:UDP-N-acetylmuramoyl-tripeptide--D-alanyl-D-alanine ligase
VVELGMNHPGEIALLAAMAQPTVALVNNAQREHQEFMGTVEAVARENGAVLQALSSDGVAVFPSDDPHTPLWHRLAAGRRVLTFSDHDPAADVLAVSAQWQHGHWRVVWRTAGQTHETRLHIAGRHNVRNAMAAAACALAAGVPLQAVTAGLQAFEPVGGRSRALSISWPSGHSLGLVDDTYNANPDSVRAAIDVLAELPSPRWLALGDMGEVGDQGLAFHLEVLRHARACGIDAVHVSGDWMRQACDALRAAGEPLPTLWDEVDALARHWVANIQQAHTAPASALVKGSRFMRMERVVQALQASTTPTDKDLTHVA